MLTNLFQKLFIKIDSVGKAEQLYIIPTLDGLKLLALNLTLLIIGLSYANNYVLLFNFVLFCLFLGSMFYTHFNLQGLILLSAKLSPLYVNKSGFLTLHFKTQSKMGHFFLNLKLKNKFIQLNDPSFSFSIQPKSESVLKVDVPVLGIKRGEFHLNRICIETFFPFHLFKCFVYFRPEIDFVIYPEMKNLQTHHVETFEDEKMIEGDEFTLSKYKPGDPLKHVHWKKLAQSNIWYLKNLTSPNAKPVLLSLDSTLKSKEELEDQLSSLSYSINWFFIHNIKFGLKLKNGLIPPAHSKLQRSRCLKALAVYEN
jgi:uncharacterized protein (DUF58 family)